MADRKELLLIMNPKSGTMLAPKHLAEIIGGFSNAGYLTKVLMTTGHGDARRFAAEYGGDVDTVVVSGGDGTLNEAIDGLISGGHKTKLGYIPAGSTNDFANSIGLPKGINECGTTILMVTHEHDIVRHFGGRIININKGVISFDEVVGGKGK